MTGAREGPSGEGEKGSKGGRIRVTLPACLDSGDTASVSDDAVEGKTGREVGVDEVREESEFEDVDDSSDDDDELDEEDTAEVTVYTVEDDYDENCGERRLTTESSSVRIIVV